MLLSSLSFASIFCCFTVCTKLYFCFSSPVSLDTFRNFRVSFFLSRCLIFKVRATEDFRVEAHYSTFKTHCQEEFFVFSNSFLTFVFVTRCLSDSFDIISQRKPVVNTYFRFFCNFFQLFYSPCTSCGQAVFCAQFLCADIALVNEKSIKSDICKTIDTNN